jgi:hypothetical protein
VWNRIAARESRTSKGLLENIFALPWLTPPRLATCALVLSAFIGSGLGLVESARANSKNWKSLETKYVQSVDPYEHLGTY